MNRWPTDDQQMPNCEILRLKPCWWDLHLPVWRISFDFYRWCWDSAADGWAGHLDETLEVSMGKSSMNYNELHWITITIYNAGIIHWNWTLITINTGIITISAGINIQPYSTLEVSRWENSTGDFPWFSSKRGLIGGGLGRWVRIWLFHLDTSNSWFGQFGLRFLGRWSARAQVVWLLLMALALFCCMAYLATDGEHWLESTFSSLFQDSWAARAVAPFRHCGGEAMTKCKWSCLE